MIRKSKISDIKEIKKLIDNTKEMDTTQETFSEDYFKRLVKKGIILLAEEDNSIIGICFGTYNKKEKWADLLGLMVKIEYRKKGIGSALVKEFEKIAKLNKLKTIDLFADKQQINLFNSLGYKKGRVYTALRKKLN